MGTERQTPEKQQIVRISGKTKKRLQTVVIETIAKEKRQVTEIELAEKALKPFLKKQERKLGIPQSPR